MAQRVAVGSGTMKQHDSRSILNEWRRSARAGSRRGAAVKPSPEQLAAIGIGVIVEERRP